MISIGEVEWMSGLPQQGIKQKMEYYNRWNFRLFETFQSGH